MIYVHVEVARPLMETSAIDVFQTVKNNRFKKDNISEYKIFMHDSGKTKEQINQDIFLFVKINETPPQQAAGESHLYAISSNNYINNSINVD